LSGKNLTGKGVGNQSEEKGEEVEEEEGFKADLDFEKIDAEIKNFTSSVSTLMENPAVKENAKSLQRDLVVMVKVINYDYMKDRFLGKYENVNVIIGPAENVDAVMKEVNPFLESLHSSAERQDRVMRQ